MAPTPVKTRLAAAVAADVVAVADAAAAASPVELAWLGLDGVVGHGGVPGGLGRVHALELLRAHAAVERIVAGFIGRGSMQDVDTSCVKGLALPPFVTR